MWAAVMLGSWVGGLVAINPRNFDTHSLLHTLYIHIPFEVVKLCFYDFIILTKIMFSKHNFNPCHCVYMYNEYTTASMSNNHYPVNCNHKLSTKEHKRPKKTNIPIQRRKQNIGEAPLQHFLSTNFKFIMIEVIIVIIISTHAFQKYPQNRIGGVGVL